MAVPGAALRLFLQDGGWEISVLFFLLCGWGDVTFLSLNKKVTKEVSQGALSVALPRAKAAPLGPPARTFVTVALRNGQNLLSGCGLTKADCSTTSALPGWGSGLPKRWLCQRLLSGHKGPCWRGSANTFPRGWCSAQRIKIKVIASGNHTIMY